MSIDEMVDGRRGVRPHWRTMLSVLTSLGHDALAERGQRLDRIAAEEGITSLLPGAAPEAWHLDPIPLPLPSAEFAALEQGLIQRAHLLDAILADLYGPQTLLSTGRLPPALVYPNPGFLRPCRNPDGDAPAHRLQFYAADLIRDADGAWQVVADHTGWPEGAAQARENRRRLGRVLPELFASQLLCPVSPFLESWQDLLPQLAPAAAPRPGGVALLSPGHVSPHWFDNVLLSRDLACALVEGGDLTVRSGSVFLKTLRGLQPIAVLLRAQQGHRVDPLELDPDAAGVPGLLDAARAGSVRIVNDPGSHLTEAPALAAFLPMLAQAVLGETLRLPNVETLWLGDPTARARVMADLAAWRLRPACNPAAPPIDLRALDDKARAELLHRLALAPSRYAATAPTEPSAAPCLGRERLDPRQVIIRMFLLFDGAAWRVMQGGLGSVLPDGAPAIWPRAGHGLAKDVWVLSESPSAIAGPAVARVPALEIRRTAGDLPSRVADDFFWLGRYLERLEGAARWLRAAIHRVGRPTPTPHQHAELDVLVSVLTQAGLLNAETVMGVSVPALTQALLRAAGSWGAVHALLGQVSMVVARLRDRITAEMHAIIARELRELEDMLARITPGRDGAGREHASLALSRVLEFAATVAGLAAENMVRGGGRLFLDLGRRIERAQAIADELACALDFPGAAEQPARAEHGLRLALELRDSVITYRSRYLSVLQPAPALDLMLADDGNPRALAYQLAATRRMLANIAGAADTSLVGMAAALLDEVQAIVRDVAAAPDQERAALALPDRLRNLRDDIAELSDRLSRRYFALLPTARAVGMGSDAPSVHEHAVRGAA
ncbi:MAG TPA: circularly permuted type 2 ATP-grasp protein [Acetobacteraceae bacterium]|jgi:uncharacterized circularly permuted ATP-grasp superfamily protein/uncharacterized alpha-E superfamily protein